MFYTRTAVFALLLSAATVHAQPAASPVAPQAPACSEPSCPLAQRGTATITIADLRAKLNTLQPKQRNALLSDGRQLSGVIETMLITRQLAQAADQEKAAADPVVQARIAQAIDEVLSVYRLDEIRDQRIKSNFETLAKEHYQTNKAAMVRPREVLVRHLLIDTKTHTDAEAQKIIQDLAVELKGADPKRFTDLVFERSDDPSKAINGGTFTVVDGDTRLDPAFVRASLALSKPGEMSAPVKTSFGYHLLQLLEVKPAGTVPFEEAKATIIEKLRQDARRRVVSEYRGELMAEGELKVYPENLETLINEVAPAAE